MAGAVLLLLFRLLPVTAALHAVAKGMDVYSKVGTCNLPVSKRPNSRHQQFVNERRLPATGIGPANGRYCGDPGGTWGGGVIFSTRPEARTRSAGGSRGVT